MVGVDLRLPVQQLEDPPRCLQGFAEVPGEGEGVAHHPCSGHDRFCHGENCGKACGANLNEVAAVPHNYRVHDELAALAEPKYKTPKMGLLDRAPMGFVQELGEHLHILGLTSQAGHRPYVGDRLDGQLG